RAADAASGCVVPVPRRAQPGRLHQAPGPESARASLRPVRAAAVAAPAAARSAPAPIASEKDTKAAARSDAASALALVEPAVLPALRSCRRRRFQAPGRAAR